MAPLTLSARHPKQILDTIEAAGQSTTTVARHVGVSRQFVYLVATGQRRCHPTVASAIAEFLGYTVGRFFTPALSDATNNKENPMSPIASLDDPFMTFDEVAEMARMTPSTLRYLRHSGRGPEFKKVGRRLKIRRSKAVEWIEADDDE